MCSVAAWRDCGAALARAGCAEYFAAEVTAEVATEKCLGRLDCHAAR